MAEDGGDQAWSGLGRRRPRMSDTETAEAMLTTALAALTRTGLTVSLDHIRLEDVIREAGVARSAVYRRWPHKDQFLGDLLLELAKASAPRSFASSRTATFLIKRTLLAELDRVRDPAHRMQLAVELVRQTAEEDFKHIYESSDWRTYLSLTVTFISLPPGRLREQVAEALAASERRFTVNMAAGYRVISELLGLRLRHDWVNFETIAQLANGMMRGLVVKALAAPELVDRRSTGRLFDVDGEWSLPALGLAGILTAYVAPDGEWDDARVERLRTQLETAKDLFAL